MVSLVLDEPAAGTGIVAIEGNDNMVAVSVWLYLYGAEGKAAAERDEPRWQAWLDELFPQPAHPGS